MREGSQGEIGKGEWIANPLPHVTLGFTVEGSLPSEPFRLTEEEEPFCFVGSTEEEVKGKGEWG